MRKHINFSLPASLLVITSTVLLIVSCHKTISSNKEHHETLPGNQKISFGEAIEQSMDLTKFQFSSVHYLLTNFEENIHDLINKKPEAGLSRRNAVWLIEADLNKTFDLLPKPRGASVLKIKQITTTLRVDDFNLLSDLSDQLETIKKEIQSLGAAVVCVDVDDTRPNKSELYIVLQILQPVSEFSRVDEYIETNCNPFGPNDYWYYSNFYQTGFPQACPSTPNTSYGSPAVLQGKLNFCDVEINFYDINSPKYHGQEYMPYPIDVVRIVPPNVQNPMFLNPNDPIPNDNWLDYIHFEHDSGIPGGDYCLEPTEMNFYRTQTAFLGNNVIRTSPWAPPGTATKTLFQFDMVGTEFLGATVVRCHIAGYWYCNIAYPNPCFCYCCNCNPSGCGGPGTE
jgi:hypothetical protein